MRRTPAVIRHLFTPQVAAALAAGLAAVAIYTSVNTSWIEPPEWVEPPETVTVVPTEMVAADQEAIDMWVNAPITIATTKAIEPRLAAIERTAANRFYRPDPRHMAVGFYGRVDPDSQQLDLDGQLDRAKRDPRGFLSQLDEVAESERRSRVAPLVVRAGRRGDAQAVARRLRDTSHPLANTLAAEFDRKRSNPAANPMVRPASY